MDPSDFPAPERAPWWQKGVVYQIYPRSFQDSDGDGVGDLKGIASRLEHVAELGADAVWLSPIFPSPMADFGYDVADYTGVDPLFGTLEDFDALLAKAHGLDLKVLLDLVPSHTSTAHPWFEASRRREGGKDDWYLWRDAKPDGSPPNNWLSCFGGPAWEFDDVRGQYYLHSWDKAQADLDHRNPEVVEAILEAMRFWFERGVDGFRVDVIEFMIKDERLRDEPQNPDWTPDMEPYAKLHHPYSRNQPDVHPVIKRMREVVDAYPGRVMIGEVFLDGDALAAYYGDKEKLHGDECHLPFNFGLIYSAWNAAEIRRRVDQYEGALAPTQWPNYVLGNHDQRRVASRVGAAQARVASTLLLTLRGTPTIYQGEELALENVPIPVERIVDPQAKNQPGANVLNRDEVRTPMPWDGSAHAGFTEPDATPWLPLADDAATRNVAAQERDATSQLALTRALLALRRAEPALSLGGYAPVEVGGAAHAVFAYTRRHPAGDAFLVVLDVSGEGRTLDLSEVAERAEIALATGMERGGTVELAALELGPDEGLVLRLAR